MPRWLPIGVVLLAALPTCQAGQVKGKLVLETWDACYLEGNRAGFVRTATYEMTQGSQKFLRTTVELQLTVKRFNQVIQLRVQSGNDETPEGAVIGTMLRQVLGQNKELTITGSVKGKQLEL